MIIELSEAEVATILMALRVLQGGMIVDNTACLLYNDILTLSHPEINELCERIKES